ncbi:MAG TPA: NirA family protein [Pirellulaceae bacterium]|jgi:ferredoxin-nitrite reductase
MASDQPFTEEQQQYLQGFAAGCAALKGNVPTFAATLAAAQGGASPAKTSAPGDARQIHWDAQDQAIAAGQKLCPEEQAKRNKDPFQMWDEMQANAAAGKFPKGTDVFLYKYHGLFYVAPAQDAFMCRLRFHGGLTNAHQFRGLAEIAEQYAGGYADVTTRANIQLREIKAENATHVVSSLLDLGIINRGAGADNIRNVTGSPTAGIDAEEIYDTRPLTKAMHHYILQHPEMVGLPRKFNIAFDGGGKISALADTNDIGFFAVRVKSGCDVPPGVYFRMELGGITGHKDFARDCGVLLKPEDCVPVAAAVVKVFIEHGDRTDRKKARLKYVLDRFGLEKYLEATQKHLAFPLRRFPLENCEPRTKVAPQGHIGFHPQRQDGKFYVGVVLPVGRLRSDQLRALADIADRYGSGTIRLTVWQNLLISDIDEADIPAVKRAIEAAGLSWSATNIRSGLVACTGNGGCKFAAANTKGHALRLAEYLEKRLELDQPVNIHLTGCPHSCAQHYIGDIGLLGTKVAVGDDMVEGYHVFVGGGYGDNREIGRQIATSVAFDDLPPLIEQLLLAWQSQRLTADENFQTWVSRKSLDELETLTRPQLLAA